MDVNSKEAALWEEIMRLRSALEACAEALALARDKLGMCGEGDGKDRRADAEDTIGSLPALIAAREALKQGVGSQSQ